jgi:hypothetical protein
MLNHDIPVEEQVAEALDRFRDDGNAGAGAISQPYVESVTLYQPRLSTTPF